jgi:hypothetical protein
MEELIKMKSVSGGKNKSKTSKNHKKNIKNYENTPVLVKRASSNTPRGSIEAEARDSISTGQKGGKKAPKSA